MRDTRDNSLVNFFSPALYCLLTLLTSLTNGSHSRTYVVRVYGNALKSKNSDHSDPAYRGPSRASLHYELEGFNRF